MRVAKKPLPLRLVYGSAGSSRRASRPIKRELGANPKQTRCCESVYQRLSIRSATGSIKRFWEGIRRMGQVRRPTIADEVFYLLSGYKATKQRNNDFSFSFSYDSPYRRGVGRCAKVLLFLCAFPFILDWQGDGLTKKD